MSVLFTLFEYSHLRVLSVASLTLTERVLVSKTDAEDPQQEAVSGLYINVGFNEGLPFLYHPPGITSF